jgi:hypothetical protein
MFKMVIHAESRDFQNRSAAGFTHPVCRLRDDPYRRGLRPEFFGQFATDPAIYSTSAVKNSENPLFRA